MSRTSLPACVPLWPLWTTIGFPGLLIALEASPIGLDLVYVLLGEPTLLLAWASIGVCAAILTVQRLRRREWRLAASSAVLPLAVFGVSLNILSFIHFCNDAGDIVHFLVERPSYIETIRATPANGEPLLLVFNRGGMIWCARGYVYDESDEVLLDPSGCGCHARAFPGPFAFTRHWYLASFGC